MAEALRGGGIAAAGIDAAVEPPPDDPLVGLDNVILTPHTAGVTVDARIAARVVRRTNGWRSQADGVRIELSIRTPGRFLPPVTPNLSANQSTPGDTRSRLLQASVVILDAACRQWPRCGWDAALFSHA